MKVRRGQVLLLSVLSIIVIIISVSSLMISTSLSGISLPNANFRESVTQIYFSSKAATAKGLADATNNLNQRAVTTMYQNYTNLEDLPSEDNLGLQVISEWLNDSLTNYPAMGLVVNFSLPIFQAEWEDPINRHAYSRAKTNVSISLASLGFEGLNDEILIEFNATLEELISSDGRSVKFKIQFLREKGYPVDNIVRDLISVFQEKYYRDNEYKTLNNTEVLSVRHIVNGTYLVKYLYDTNNITRNLNLLREEITNLPEGSLVSSKSVSSDISLGWHMIAGVRDGNYLRLYIDGEPVTPEDIQDYGTINNDKSLLAAAEFTGGQVKNHFKGVIDEIRLSRVSRSQAWLQTNYDNHNNEGFMNIGPRIVLGEPWQGNWDYRSDITVYSYYVNATLVDYPLLATLNPSNFDYSYADPNGDDIRFTSESGDPLDYEIEKWSTSGESKIWVSIPVLSSSEDTVLRMYYGNPLASSDEDPESVWSAFEYSLVEHLEEPSGSHYDSTSFENLGTYEGSHQNFDGIIDGADSFNAVDEYIAWPDDASLNPGSNDFTLFLWADVKSQEVNRTLACKGDFYNNTGVGYKLYIDNYDKLIFEIDNNDDNLTRNEILGIIDEIESKYDATERISAYQQLLLELRPKLNPESEETLVETGTETEAILYRIDRILDQLRPVIRLVARDNRGITVSVYGELITPTGDYYGPNICNEQAQPHECGTGESITLQATADDRWNGNSTISIVEYFVSDTQPGSPLYGSGTAMTPNDGAFNEPLEQVNATISSNDLDIGENTIWIHGKDAEENWGEFKSLTVTVISDNTLHIESVDLQGFYGYWWFYRYNWVRATVTIVDGVGAPVEGADVHGIWSGDVSGSDDRITISDGTCVFDSEYIWGYAHHREYTFTVNPVSKDGYEWDGQEVTETLYYP